MPDMREQFRDELRSCLRRGVRPPTHPDAAALWDACDGDGPLALLVALEFLAARREFREDQARAYNEERRFAA